MKLQGKSTNPQRRTEKLIVQQMGRETLVYDETCHKAHCLNEVASAVWACCDGASLVEAIAQAASVSLGVAVTEEVVLLALEQLRNDGLMEVVAESAISPALLSRRAMAIKIGIGAAMMLPIVTTIVAPKAAHAYNGCADC